MNSDSNYPGRAPAFFRSRSLRKEASGPRLRFCYGTGGCARERRELLLVMSHGFEALWLEVVKVADLKINLFGEFLVRRGEELIEPKE